MFVNKNTGDKSGWFSRRHQTREALDNNRQANQIKRQEKLSNAQERNKATAKLSPQERIAHLDASFGEGQGAKRERARLQAMIDLE